jgi:hypothetical protein
MRAALILLLFGSFATSALAAEAAEIHDPTFQPGYAYAEPSAGQWQPCAPNAMLATA